MRVASTFVVARRGRDTIASLICLAVVIGTLYFINSQARAQMESVVSGGVAPWQHRATELASTLWLSVRAQSLESGTWVLFAVVGAVLFVIMVKM
jgi:hypothetical protein